MDSAVRNASWLVIVDDGGTSPVDKRRIKSS
jgi:hypothetical protein